MTEPPSRLVQDLMERTDGWPGGAANESALDYNYMTRHFTMSVIFLCYTCIGVAIGSVGNIFVSKIKSNFVSLCIFSYLCALVHVQGIKFRF